MDKDKLPTNDMANATPTRKMYSATEEEQPNIQVTPQTKKGDLAFLRSQGITSVNLGSRDRRRTGQRPR